VEPLPIPPSKIAGYGTHNVNALGSVQGSLGDLFSIPGREFSFLTQMSKKLVKAFNALPRSPKALSGSVPNEWHFDIRYIQIEPTPSHVLFLLQPQSEAIHIERLPLGLSPRASGNAFFPESCKEAAPELAKGLLHSFVNNLGLKLGEKIFGAPWELSTESKGLAEAVGEEFKRLGVRAEALWTIGVSSSPVNDLALEVFHDYFDTLIESIGLSGLPPGAIAIPKSIVFSTCKVDSEPLHIEANSVEEQEFNLTWHYVQLREAASPRIELDPSSNQMSARHKTFTAIHRFLMGLKERTEEVVRAEADAGDPEASVDYGLRYASHHYVCAGDLPVSNNRLYLGVACTRNRTLSRVYFIKALSACSATDTLKAMTHGLLINWYMSIKKGFRVP
jgi:hypothetical protein